MNPQELLAERLKASCKRKVRHATEQSARAAALKIGRRGKKMTWYPCDFCKGYHVSHERRKR